MPKDCTFAANKNDKDMKTYSVHYKNAYANKLIIVAAENALQAVNECMISNVRTANANSASVQGAINALNVYIKQVASVNGLDKKIVAALKGEAAQTLLQQVTDTTLPLYIDNKGNYKTETLYRLIASKAKNTELRILLNNMDKASK